jgi:Cd2+/Zn2+-exporting ATPase
MHRDFWNLTDGAWLFSTAMGRCGMLFAMAGTTTQLDPTPKCLVQTVADVMRREPALEAVKIDRARSSISLATLGQTDPGLERVVTQQIRALREQKPSCRLLEGDPSCESCSLTFDPALKQSLNIQQDRATTTIARVTCPTAPSFWKWRAMPLPRIVPREVHVEDEETHQHEWKQQLFAASLCGIFLALASFLPKGIWTLPLYLASFLCGAWFTAQEVWEHLREGKVDVHFLMLTVAAGGAAIGAWGEGAILLFLFSLSGALEHFAMGRTQREISALFKSAPKSAIVLGENHSEQIVPVEQLTPGQRLLVKPGEQFPVDAELVSGSTSADESNLTGEATPVDKGVGDAVFAGTINLWGAVEVLVSRPASQSALQRIIRLIKEAQHLKAPSQRFTDRFGSGYTYAILALTLVMFFVWWLAFKLPPFTSTPEVRSAFYKAMTLLVVASPCALVLSIPSAVLAAIASGARRGVLFRGGAAVEKLADTQVVAMDKTGTLTTGELRVEAVESFPPGREREVGELAFSLERLSTHPLARAVTRYGKRQGTRALALEKFESVTGLGLRAEWGGKPVLLGRRGWVTQSVASPNGTEAAPSPGISEVWLAHGDLLGRITLRDDIRAQARVVIDALRKRGLETVVLTGDRREAAEHLKAQLAVDDVRAELKPEQKVEAIRSFIERNQRVAMIGDGVNDAPSLAAADIGVAMGARGADAALEQAEVVLMHDRLENFLTALKLSCRARAIIRQNLVISLGTVAVLVVCAMLGKIPLTLGVIGHEGSTVIVVLNSLRLLLRDKAS